MSERDANSTPRIDAETIAALIDGRLDAEERARVLEQLAASPEDYDAYVDAVQLTRELDASGIDEGITPSAPPPTVARIPPAGARSSWQRWLAAAAVLALVVTTTWLLVRRDAGYLPGTLAAAIDPAATSIQSWDQPPWRVVRSGGSTLSEPQLAVRLGVRLLNLELAERAGDTTATREAARQVQLLAEQLRGGSVYAALYRGLDTQPRADEERRALLRTGWQSLTEALPTAELQLGSWLAAARLALLSENAAWLQSESARAARDAIDAQALQPAVRAEWLNLVNAMNEESADVREQVDAVLRAAAG